MREFVGWDVGGVNTKAVWLCEGEGVPIRSASRPFEVWRARDQLPLVMREVYDSLAVGQPDAMAITMTAELSDTFRSKEEGVRFVLDATHQAFGDMPIYLLRLSGTFATLEEALRCPADFAAANWLASALFLAEQQTDCLLVDIGSTTADIIPIMGGHVLAEGRDDTARLMAGELVYSGVIRTNPNTLASRVPLRGRWCALAAEQFCVMGDVYLVLGLLQADQYAAPTPDGRGKTPAGARLRLARLVCADAETLDDAEIQGLARYLYERQLQQILDAVCQVLSRFPNRRLPVAAVGTGRFLALDVAQRLGLDVCNVHLPDVTALVLPCLAVASLLRTHLRGAGE